MILGRGDRLSGEREPAPAVGSLVAAIGLVFVCEQSVAAAGAAEMGEFIGRWGLVPREFLREIAAPGATQQIVWLTPLTAMFLHSGWFHVAANAFYLWVFGSPIEASMGRVRFVIFYFICGLAAATVHVASAPGAYLPAIGASGAISGVLGAYAIAVPRARPRRGGFRSRIPVEVLFWVWIVIQVLSGLAGAADGDGAAAWWAHAGGFTMGAALAGSMWASEPVRSRLRI